MISEKIDKLQGIFESILDKQGPVYSQPPGNIEKYPCIIFRRKNTVSISADNTSFLKFIKWEVTVIGYDQGEEISIEILNRFPMATQEAMYVVDGLYHSILEITY